MTDLKIVNLHRWPGMHKPPFNVIYCGRAIKGRYGRKASPLANPFKAKKGDPESLRISLDLYRKWLFSKIRTLDREVLRALDEIRDDSVLGCMCVSLDGEDIFTEPEVCHLQVIAKCLRWMRENAVVKQVEEKV